MNANFIRTLLTWGAIVVTAATSIFGCTADVVTGAYNCAGSWLPPQYAGFITVGLLVVNQILKAFQGGAPGTGLVAPTVPVVAASTPGTVTQAQVDAGK